MRPILTALAAGSLAVVAQPAAISPVSSSISGLFMLVFPAIAFVQVLLTSYRVCGAAR
jgi:hypothetical protein